MTQHDTNGHSRSNGGGSSCRGNGQDDANRGRRVRVHEAGTGNGHGPVPYHGANGHGKNVLITGGAGFIGTNLADRLLSEGEPVTILDDLSRPGVGRNLEWLQQRHGRRLQTRVRDVRDPVAVTREVRRASAVFHLAGQVAVTTSICSPRHDFEVNARGTLNVLEALRRLDDPPPLLFTSTNKVYGDLGDVELVRDGKRWTPADGEIRTHGISELRPLDFHSPYGCSKGTADQYVLDYARTYGLPAMVFRMSCIYGPHQCGTEDQGWVAHFLISMLDEHPLTLYGDGHQVRDVLFVEDLVAAMLAARENIDEVRGRAFNIGGGAANSTSLLELLEGAGEIHGRPADPGFADWRTGDQRYYVSDTRAFGRLTGWKPRATVQEGVERLYRWLADHRQGAATGRGTVAVPKPALPEPSADRSGESTPAPLPPESRAGHVASPEVPWPASTASTAPVSPAPVTASDPGACAGC